MPSAQLVSPLVRHKYPGGYGCGIRHVRHRLTSEGLKLITIPKQMPPSALYKDED